MFLNKKGEMMTKETLEILLGGAIVLVLLFLLYNLISPTFNLKEETAKSYFESLEAEIVVADKEGGVGSFSIWQPSDKKNKEEYFLVYFGDSSKVVYGNKKFFSFGDNSNHTCICSWEKDADKCQYCMNLDSPVRINGEEKTWAVGVGDTLKITKEENFYYEFTTSTK